MTGVMGETGRSSERTHHSTWQAVGSVLLISLSLSLSNIPININSTPTMDQRELGRVLKLLLEQREHSRADNVLVLKDSISILLAEDFVFKNDLYNYFSSLDCNFASDVSFYLMFFSGFVKRGVFGRDLR